MKHTLPKIHILRGFKSFSETITKGKSLSSGCIRCYYRHAVVPTQVSIKVGFAVNKKIRTKANRNTVRRLMKESFRLNVEELRRGLEEEKPLEIVLLYTRTKDELPRKAERTEIFNSIREALGIVIRSP